MKRAKRKRRASATTRPTAHRRNRRPAVPRGAGGRPGGRPDTGNPPAELPPREPMGVQWGFSPSEPEQLDSELRALTPRQRRYLVLRAGDECRRTALRAAGYRPRSDRNADKMIAVLERRLAPYLTAIQDAAFRRANINAGRLALVLRQALDSANMRERLMAVDLVGRMIGLYRGPTQFIE